MSTDESHPRPALGARENFFAHDHDSDHDREESTASDESGATEHAGTDSKSRYRTDTAAADRGGHDPSTGTDKLQWIATSILYRAPGAVVVCPECYVEFELENELTDPSVYVPESVLTDDDGDDTTNGSTPTQISGTGAAPVRRAYEDHRRHRYCPECGLVAWGGILLDRPQEQFVAVVEDVLDVADLPPSLTTRIYSRADARKKKQWGDKKNLRRTLHEIKHPESIAEGTPERLRY